MRNFKKLKIDFFLVFLILISVFLCYKNYTPNSFLSGWDTLHPEFNFNLYWQRITSFWQEHQGLGAPPSQAHVAELPRIIFSFLSSLILPSNFIRYIYFFLMMIVGPIGVYLLLRYIIYQLDNGRDELVNKISSFLGALFYLLNLGTMQHFIVPLEMFATKFGFLGFLYLFALKFLNEGKKKNLIIFSLLTIFASLMAHTATLWYVYFAGLILFLAMYSLLTRNLIKNVFKKSLFLIIFTLILNLFWILPNLYYVANYNHEVINSKIHRLGTEEFYYHNKKYGNISNFLLLKNFLFDWYVTNNNGKTQPLLASWSQHLKNPNILIIAYLLSFASLVGVVFALHRKNTIFLSFIPLILFSVFFLLSDTPGVSPIFDWLRNTAPLIKEVFRFPFTKFSIYLIFCLSLFFGYFHYVFLKRVLSFLSKLFIFSLSTKIFFASLYLYFFLFLILIYNLPAFSGNFISQIVRVKIPKEYFSLFSWSRKQNYGRILLFPLHDPYGWTIYQWNQTSTPQVYQGAGFTWFGLKQPTLNSEFNRWYLYNEQSYREFFYAVYSKNPLLFEKLLQKYHIGYILLDENVIIPGKGENSKKLFYPEIKELLAKIENIRLTQKFGEKISLYEYLSSKEKQPVEILTDYKIVEPSYRWNYIDEAYQKFGNYITSTSQKHSDKQSVNLILKDISDNLIIYPARNLLTKEEKINQKILSIGEHSYQISLPTTLFPQNSEIKIPTLTNTESEFYAEVYGKKINEETIIELKYLLPYFSTEEIYKKQFILKDKNPRLFSINNKIFLIPEKLSQTPFYLGEVILSTKKENFLSFYNTERSKNLASNFSFNLSPYLCSQSDNNQVFGAETLSSGFKIYGQKAKICLDIPLQHLIKIEKDGALHLTSNYLIETNSAENKLCLFDQSQNRCLITKIIKPSFSPTIDFIFPINQEKSASYFLRFSFDTRKEEQIKEFFIKNLIFNFYEKTNEKIFVPEIPPFELETEEFKLKGKFPKQKIEITPQIIGVEKNDCGFEKARLIDKQFIEINEGIILEYKAIDGSICDSIPLLDISQNIGHILAIESQNLSGLPLKICLEDQETKICHLEERLSKNKNFTFDYFIIPPYYQKNGYRLLINNYSIGNVVSINRIKTVKLIPFPYLFFQAIRWESYQNSKNINSESLPRFEKIVKKIHPFLYQVELEKNLPENSLLVLDQAYEKNWKAYFVPNFQFPIFNFQFLTKYFPFLFGQELKNHVLVNNWANGWLVENSQSWLKMVKNGQSSSKLVKTSSNEFQPVSTSFNKFQPISTNYNQPQRGLIITIIFLPQYLQFLGFGFLILALINIVFFYKIKKYEN